MSNVAIDFKRLGSVRAGHRHWWWQRVSALLLVPLALWFIGSAVLLDLSNIEIARGWLAQPFTNAKGDRIIMATLLTA